jgi:hypothetical protein
MTRKPNRRDELGAEAVEFAFVGPVLLGLIFALMYVLLGVAAHVSVSHAASVGARYASIVDRDTGTYPDHDAVEAKMNAASPFFRPEACETVLAGEAGDNAPIHIDVSCPFPNPIGRAVNKLLDRDAPAGITGDEITLAASAKARRE